MSVEETPYRIAFKVGVCEVRDYPALLAAEVSVKGSRQASINSGFRLLAGYIFGANTTKKKIAMTAPIIQVPKASETIAMTAPVTQTALGDSWVVRFIMPKGYTIETLPIPDNPEVRLITLSARKVAVIRFSGLGQEADIKTQTLKLKAFIDRHKLWASGPVTLARYDPPWTLWFMRRNELIVALVAVGCS
jgi:hypothetical protein